MADLKAPGSDIIGKLRKVPLREVWKDEAKDFTGWLAKNIDSLAEELGWPITIVKREKAAGNFSADLLAEGQNGEMVVIENQLEQTNHDHLGKLITYLANLGAKKAVWVTSNARAEHLKAIDWLNETTPPDFSFYLVTVEAFRIGDSPPAPQFQIARGPSEEAKKFGTEKREFAERHQLRMDFWKSLLDKSQPKTELFSNVSPGHSNWIATGAGRAGFNYAYVISKKWGSIELYIDRGKDKESVNKRIFDQLQKSKASVEKIFGGPLKWDRMENRRACRIRKTYTEGNLADKATWDRLQEMMIDGMIRLDKALRPLVESLTV